MKLDVNRTSIIQKIYELCSSRDFIHPEQQMKTKLKSIKGCFLTILKNLTNQKISFQLRKVFFDSKSKTLSVDPWMKRNITIQRSCSPEENEKKQFLVLGTF